MLALILLLAAALTGPPSRPDQAAPLKLVTSLTDLWRHRPGDRGRPGERDLDRPGGRGSPLRSAEAELRLRCCAMRTCSSPPDWISSSGCRRCSTARATARSRRAGPATSPRPRGSHLLEIPTSLSRSAGDIHVDGNPAHPHRSAERDHHRPQHPRGTEAGLAPGRGSTSPQREQDFERRVLEATMGQELVQILTPATAFSLLQGDKLNELPEPAEVPGQAAGGPSGRLAGGERRSCVARRWPATTRSGPTSAIASRSPA